MTTSDWSEGACSVLAYSRNSGLEITTLISNRHPLAYIPDTGAASPSVARMASINEQPSPQGVLVSAASFNEVRSRHPSDASL